MSVVMIGPSRKAKGGVSAVLSLYQDGGLFDDGENHLLASTSDGPWLEKLLWFLGCLVRFLLLLLTESGIRIVHVHMAVRASVVRKSLIIALARLFHKKVVLHFHGAQFNVLYDRSPALIRWLLVWSFRQADAVLCLSRTCQVHIQDQLGIQAQVMPNPTRLRLPVSQKDQQPVHFLLMGRLGKRKGVYELIEAAAQVPRDQVRIHLYGDGELPEIQRAVQATGVSDRVLVHGWVSGPEKEQAFQRSQVLVLPSHNEGLPVSVLEALSYGMPVIATPVGGIADAVKDGENGFLVEPGDIGQLADRIMQLARSASLRQSMGLAGHRLARRQFDLPQVLAQLEGLYVVLAQEAPCQPAGLRPMAPEPTRSSR